MKHALLACLLLTACVDKGKFLCHGQADCASSGGAGVCESTGFCSFTDPGCGAGRRYGSLSGPFADQCVGEDAGPIDAAVHDGGPDGALPIDGAVAIDGGPTVDAGPLGPLTPVVIANAGALINATGHGSQTHLIWAANSHEWWLFYNDTAALSSLKTRHSPDFVTWQDGASVVLPEMHAMDGRDLSVAYKSLGGRDIVHITQGCQNHNRYHIKATITGTTVSFGTPKMINGGSGDDPDGAATVITDSGQVIDSTGWLSTPQAPPLTPCGSGDVVMFESTAVDTGLNSFDAMTWNTKVIWCLDNQVGARQLLTKNDVVYQLYEDGDSTPPTKVNFQNRTAAGVWLPVQPGSGSYIRPVALFTAAQYQLDDFVGALGDTQLHAVRRSGAGSNSYEHWIFDIAGDSGTWHAGGNIPSEGGVADSGLFLTRYGSGMVLFAIKSDATKVIRFSQWDGANWSAWATLVTGTADRHSIAGSSPEAGAPPAVIWTQANGPNFDIVGVKLP